MVPYRFQRLDLLLAPKGYRSPNEGTTRASRRVIDAFAAVELTLV